MDRAAFLPLSGFRDYLNPTKLRLIGELKTIFESYGYQALETPALERQEILLGKLGDEGQKQLYLFEDNGRRKVGLRYDLTVPLARYVVANLGSLALPFKRYEIGPVWRAEKPQKGRYRQFTQADIDIIGAPASAEFEILSIVARVAQKLKLELVCYLNDRRLVAELLDHCQVSPDSQTQLLRLLDKKDKMTPERFEKELKDLPLSDNQRRQISGIFLGKPEEALTDIERLVKSPSVTTLRTLLAKAKDLGLKAEFNPAMVRGLEYYTGTIFECVVPGYDAGTVIAGGRYDSLVENLTGQKLPAVGISFGVDRLADLLSTAELNETLFVVRLPETSSELDKWVCLLRDTGKNVEVFLDESVELGKQIKYADKRGYSSILIPFENEWKQGQIVRKFLESGTQEAIDRATFDDKKV